MSGGCRKLASGAGNGEALAPPWRPTSSASAAAMAAPVVASVTDERYVGIWCRHGVGDVNGFAFGRSIPQCRLQFYLRGVVVCPFHRCFLDLFPLCLFRMMLPESLRLTVRGWGAGSIGPMRTSRVGQPFGVISDAIIDLSGGIRIRFRPVPRL